MVLRHYNSSGRNWQDLVICTVLLKHMVAMLDGVHIAVKAGSAKPALLAARAAFEASLYLHWILKGDTQTKAYYYYVEELRRQLDYLGLALASPRNEPFHAVMLADKAELERILCSPQFAPFNERFIRSRGNAPHDPNWYTLIDKRIGSVRALAKEIGQLPDYALIYDRTSEVMHAKSYRDHLQMKAGVATLRPIRDAAGVKDALQFALLTAPTAYLQVTERYRPAECRVLMHKYQERWRPALAALQDLDELALFNVA